MRSNLIVVFGLLLFLSCTTSEARRPVTQRTSTITSKIIAENKKLNEIENQKIKQLIALDSTHTYQTSLKGFWYRYLKKVVESTPFPKQGDVVTIQYDIQDLDGNIIYNQATFGLKKYVVDKEDFIPGLQDGIKLMKVGETITFVIPSYRAFGVTGDGNKIGINQSVQSTVSLISIK